MTSCDVCNGEGVICVCCDDICQGRGECIHGDGMAVCDGCNGTGLIRDDDDLDDGWDDDWDVHEDAGCFPPEPGTLNPEPETSR